MYGVVYVPEPTGQDVVREISNLERNAGSGCCHDKVAWTRCTTRPGKQRGHCFVRWLTKSPCYWLECADDVRILITIAAAAAAASVAVGRAAVDLTTRRCTTATLNFLVLGCNHMNV